MEMYMADIMSNLYGNPHSASPSSQLAMNRIEDIRLKALQFFNADPEDFDLIFVANATAGIKLVMDGLRDHRGGFAYGYHKDAHTSLIGVRESAVASRCMDDADVENWLSGKAEHVTQPNEATAALFAYPAQSNMNGRRLPLSWARRVRALQTSSPRTYTLLDAAALVATTPLDLSDVSQAPDFTVLSFYKIFGFPDLGALVVRKDAGHVLQARKYFGGGTVDVVTSLKEQWHVFKSDSLHESFEDGTLPFHNIMALNASIESHKRLYESMERISEHTTFLARKLYDGLTSLKHANSESVCIMHSDRASDPKRQGSTVAFNLRNAQGGWITNTEFNKLASIKKIHVRTGGLCNPGGIASSLHLAPWEIRRNFSAGFKCGAETDIFAGKITGVIRASLGAMSTMSDVEAFLEFVKEFYQDKGLASLPSNVDSVGAQELKVESLTIYPIKSCGGTSIPPGLAWEIRPEGLAWDREWCLVHQGTGQALSQKRHSKMALIKSALDFDSGVLRVWYTGKLPAHAPDQIEIPLSANPALFKPFASGNSLQSRVCGDTILARIYNDEKIASFFTSALGVPCALARFPAGGVGCSTRHSKAHLQKHQQPNPRMSEPACMPGTFPDPVTPPDSDTERQTVPILLSNESPILAINRASIDALNREIAKTNGKPASASVFRANIVLGPASTNSSDQSPAYCEDHWQSIHIGKVKLRMLGSCRRCHMVCVDQETAESNEEPFVSLARTRRFESKVFFGVHMCLSRSKGEARDEQFPTVMVGERVVVDAKRIS